MYLYNIISIFSILNSLSQAFYLPGLNPVYPILQESTNLTNITLPTSLSYGKLTCSMSYGENLNYTSCFDAWKSIPRDSDIFYTYGSRKTTGSDPSLDFGLPVRYLSDDGSCAIDIRGKLRHDKDLVTGDTASNIQISEAAKVVLNRCVPAGEGGQIYDFSQRNLLSLVITKSEVQAMCDPHPDLIPFYPFCEKVLQTLPVKRQQDVFSSSEATERPGEHYTLPRNFEFRKSDQSHLPSILP